MTVDEMLTDLGRRFPKYLEALKAWAPSYRRKLAALKPQQIEALYSRCIDDWDKAFPPRAVDILKEIRQWEAEPTRKPLPSEWAQKVMTLPEGQIALRDGCARELWCWALAHQGQVPNADVLAECMIAERRFQARLDDLEAGRINLPAGLIGKAAWQAGQSMCDFEARLRHEYRAPSRGAGEDGG